MYANANTLLREVMQEVWTPREALHFDEWCDKYRVLATDGSASARSGPWDTENTPYLREPMRRIFEPEVREIAFWKSAQVGYTDGITINLALYLLAELRQASMIVYPTEDKGRAYNRRRLMPAVRACPIVSGLIARKHDLTDKELRIGGVPLWFGYTGSRDALRGDPVGFIDGDEIDAFDKTIDDPLTQCRSRQTTFRDRKFLKGSTPMDEAGIVKEYTTAHVRWTFMVPCPLTGRFFELWTFDQLGWFGGIDADPAEVAKNTWVVSPFAGEGERNRIREHCKPWMVRNGLWVTQDETIESDGSILQTLDRSSGEFVGLKDHPEFSTLGRLTSDFFRDEREEPDHRARNAGMEPERADELRAVLGVRIVGRRNRGTHHGFRINSLVSLLDGEGWGGSTGHFVTCKGNPEPTWWRERFGHVPKAGSKHLEIQNLEALCLGSARGGHEFGEVPDFAVATFCTVDVQKHCIKAGIGAFGMQGLDFALCLTREIPREEDNLLRETRLRETLRDLAVRRIGSTQLVRPHGFFIDARHWTEDVIELTRYLRSQRIWAWPVFGSQRDAMGRAVWRTVLTEKRLPDGQKETRPDPVEAIHFSDEYLSTLMVSRVLATPNTRTGELEDLDGVELGPDALIRGRVQLPGLGSWPDGRQVLAEMANVQRVRLGIGSGLSGPDGRGKAREEWRKRFSHRANDWFDVTKMQWIGSKLFQLERWTAEAKAARLQRPDGWRQVGEARLD